MTVVKESMKIATLANMQIILLNMHDTKMAQA